MDKIGICQRKMLRKVIGWVRYDGEQWETTMQRMKLKVENGMRQYLVKPWGGRIESMKTKYFQRLEGMEDRRWEKLSFQWEPTKVDDNSQEYYAHRCSGRPVLRWFDY